MDGTQNPETGVEDERLNELASNDNRTPEETTEFEGLRKAKDDKTAKSRIEELSGKSKDAERKALQAEARAEQAEKRIAELEARKPDPRPVSTNQVEAGGKMWDTDDTLRAKIYSGSLTENAAYKMQQDRNNEIAADKAYNRLKGEQDKTQAETQLKRETEEVFDKHPSWQRGHKDYNPDDPLYKLAEEFYRDGMSIKNAMLKAEKYGPKSNGRPDMSDQLGVHGASAPSSERGETQKEVTLTSIEEDGAVRMYRNQTNPNTGRTYTAVEAIAKAKKAKSSRPTRRV